MGPFSAPRKVTSVWQRTEDAINAYASACCLRAGNTMKHTLRCHDFGGSCNQGTLVGELAIFPMTVPEAKIAPTHKGLRPESPARRSAEQGPRLRGWDRVGVHRTAVMARSCPAPGSHPSTNRLEPAPPSAGPLSLGLPIQRVLPSPRFALSTILTHNARAFHCVTGSKRC